MSMSHVPSSDVNDIAAATTTDSVTTTVTKVADATTVSSVLSDLGQHLTDRMRCFIELNWWISTIPTVRVFQGFLTPLFLLIKDIDQRNKVKFWEEPMKPSKWRKEDVIFLSGSGLLMFGEYKLLVWLTRSRDEKLVEG